MHSPKMVGSATATGQQQPIHRFYMPYFKYHEDKLPVGLFTALFCVDLLMVVFVERPLLLSVYALLTLLPKVFIAAWNHHHQHCPVFRQKALNRALEVVYTFHTGITTNVWVLHHNLGHHLNYLDQTKDESGWKRADGTPMGVVEYTFTIALTGYLRALGVSRRYPKFRQDLFAMGLVNAAILCLLLIVRPLGTLLVFCIPMLLVYLGTCWTTYYHHAGLDSDDHLHASHNNLNSFYNILTGNLGYHTAHHMKQGLHWSKLPEYHATIEEDIPCELIARHFPGTGFWKTS